MNITYEISGDYAIRHDPDWSLVSAYQEIWRERPVIGQKYMVVFFCDYDNTEYGDNYPIEITEDNIAEITFHMNDTENDITEYILIEQ
jgi:hypothetical protein